MNQPDDEILTLAEVVSTCIEQPDNSEVVDIKALNAKIAGIVARQAELRQQIDAIVAELEGDTG